MEKLMQSSRRGNLTRILDALGEEFEQAKLQKKEKREITHVFTQEDLGLLSDKGLEYNPAENQLNDSLGSHISGRYVPVKDSYSRN